MLCCRCGRLGHKEANCSEATEVRKDTLVSLANTRGDGGMAVSENSHTPWKAVQTRRPRARGITKDNYQCPKLGPREPSPPNTQHVNSYQSSFNSHVLRDEVHNSG